MNEQTSSSKWMAREGMALLTDLYQLTMLSGYLKHGIAETRGTFEYFFRTLPPDTGMVITAGLSQFLQYLNAFQFSDSDLAYLDSLNLFDGQTLDYLQTFRPRVDVMAIPEGTPVFPHEPIVRITGPLAHAQLIETFLLNALNYPSLIATKTARICHAAQGEPVLEFGLRRAQGPDGAVTGSRGAYIGGAAATSNVLAGRLYGIPVRGTIAHSWIMGFSDEPTAFRAFADTFPNNCTLLVDTYDTLGTGVPNAIEVFRQNPGIRPSIRIDSGDLAKLSKSAHAQFQAAGFSAVDIVGTNDLDEDLIADLKRQGARINLWAVGTHLITAKDHPALDGVYKLVAVEENGQWRPRMKVSSNPDKATDPGVKQPYRCFDADGRPVADILIGDDEPAPSAGTILAKNRRFLHLERTITEVSRIEPLMARWVQNGQPVKQPPPLDTIRAHRERCLNQFPEEYHRLRNPEIYWIGLSARMAELKKETLATLI